MDQRVIFSSVYGVWNRFLPYYKYPFSESSKIAPIAKVIQRAVVSLALAIATIVAVIFSLVTFPYCYYKQHFGGEARYANDLNLLNDSKKEPVLKEIFSYMNSKCSEQIPKSLQKEYAQKILAYYCRSHQIYGPIARAWTEYLLEKANRENKKLIFLARDGIAPYKIAKKLMQQKEYQKKYPNLCAPASLGLAYFSRKAVNSSVALLKEYATKELGLREGDSCLFADIGFEGSMIETIRKNLSNIDIQFEYLISITDKATGFLADKKRPLPSVGSAGGHLGIHWLEDSHQGSAASPQKLVAENGHIYPDSLYPKKKRCVEMYTLEHLLRRFAKRAIVNWANFPSPAPESLEKIRSTFDETLYKIKTTQLPLLITHY